MSDKGTSCPVPVPTLGALAATAGAIARVELRTNSAIVATAQAITLNAISSSLISLPDGTVMTLVGITQVQLQAALLAGILFKP